MIDDDFVIATLILGALLGVILWLAVTFMDYKCSAAWPKSLKPDWKIVAGCTVEVRGERIPASAYRVL